MTSQLLRTRKVAHSSREEKVFCRLLPLTRAVKPFYEFDSHCLRWRAAQCRTLESIRYPASATSSRILSYQPISIITIAITQAILVKFSIDLATALNGSLIVAISLCRRRNFSESTIYEHLKGPRGSKFFLSSVTEIIFTRREFIFFRKVSLNLAARRG